jgi:hypothetical protein
MPAGSTGGGPAQASPPVRVLPFTIPQLKKSAPPAAADTPIIATPADVPPSTTAADAEPPTAEEGGSQHGPGVREEAAAGFVDLTYNGPGNQNAILAARFPNFTHMTVSEQETAFERFLSGGLTDSDSAATYMGNQQPQGAHAYALSVRGCLAIELGSLASSAAATVIGQLRLQRHYGRKEDRMRFLFPDMTYLVHPERLSLLFNHSDYMKPSCSLVVRCQALIKAVGFLRHLFSPAQASTLDVQIQNAEVMLTRARSTGGRFQRNRLLANDIAKAHRPPLIGDLPRFAADLVANMTRMLAECVKTSKQAGNVSSLVFNRVTAVMKLALWCEVPLQRPSVIDHCYVIEGSFVSSFVSEQAGLAARRTEVEAIQRLIKKVSKGREHLVAEMLELAGRWGIRVLQKKCAWTGKKEVSVPFFPFSDDIRLLVEAYRALSMLTVRPDTKRVACRRDGAIVITPLLQTARGVLANTPTVLAPVCYGIVMIDSF